MPTWGFPDTAPYADVKRIGIPRALLFYRYEVLWTTFFEALGCTVVLSEPTTKNLVEAGDALSNDECCLASKVYMGHVAALIDTCDAIFVPSIHNVGRRRAFCTKFQALPDLVANTFNDQVHIVSCLVNEVEEHLDMKAAFTNLAEQFGATKREAERIWKEAAHAQEQAQRQAALAQTQRLATLQSARAKSTTHTTPDTPLGILFAAHPYVAHDPYIGGVLVDLLERMNTVVAFTDAVDRERALLASFDFSETLPWIVNRELIGAITILNEHIDGIVLVSAFPCGPDSMTDDAILRCIQGKPILNLTIDAQSGSAGLETRIESFVDILRYQKKGGYVHGA